MDIHQRVQGIGVPPKQTQGDTWSAVINESTYNPTHLYLICGSNDIDKTNDFLYFKFSNCQYTPLIFGRYHKPSVRYHRNSQYKFKQFSMFDPCAYIEARLDQISGHID